MISNKIKCPCCGYFSIDTDDEVIVDICEICLWQYDEVAQENPNKIIGANKVSLNTARENYLKYGVSKIEYIGKNLNRKPEEADMCNN